MRKLGVISLIIGLFIVAFPALVGRLVIGSAAYIIALLSLFAAIVMLAGRRYIASLLALLFLATSVRIMIFPSLLLKYAGFALILSSALQILMMRRKTVLLSSASTLLLGILAYMNSHASLMVTTVIMGILFAGIGFLLLFWDSFVSRTPNNQFIFRRTHRAEDSDDDDFFVRQSRPIRNIKIDEEVEEIEEADFTDVE